jgi:hypothetical protein
VIAGWFRWLPIAVGRKQRPTLVEQRIAFGTNTDRRPRRTQEANPAKLRAKEARHLNLVEKKRA